MTDASRGLPSPASISADESNLKPYSCLLCRQRKVKCSRTKPCRVCSRANVPCEYVAPAPARRHRTAKPRESLHARLQRYERRLNDYEDRHEGFEGGHSNDEGQFQNSDDDRTKRGKLFLHRGSSRYLDSGIWTNLTKEIDNPPELFSDSSEHETPSAQAHSNYQVSDEHYILFGTGTSDLGSRHPDSFRIEKLWQTFCDIVDPVTKLVHVPSLRKVVNRAISAPQQLGRSEEALLFNVYFLTILSMKEEDCLMRLGQDRLATLSNYRTLARQSLANASLLKTNNFVVLQAYVIYLTAIRPLCDSSTMLALSAVALRIARRIGVHRDGAFLNISPFEAEMRRRVWWSIVILEYRLAEACGSSPSADLAGDTKVAHNLNDADLDPEMTSMPPERVGMTDMSTLMVRNYAMSTVGNRAPDTSDARNLDFAGYNFAARDALIDQLQETYEQKILRYCDPLEPLHILSSLTCRAILCKLRVAAHSPFQYADKDMQPTQAARDIVWENGRKLLEYGHLMQSTPSIEKYLWIVGSQAMWDSFIYILGELRHRKAGVDVNYVWDLVAKTFEYYPYREIESNTHNFLALGIWTLRVWDDTLAAREAADGTKIPDPPYITRLRKTRSAPAARSSSNLAAQQPTSNASENQVCTDISLSGNFNNIDDIFDMPLAGFDWTQFDQMFQ